MFQFSTSSYRMLPHGYQLMDDTYRLVTDTFGTSSYHSPLPSPPKPGRGSSYSWKTISLPIPSALKVAPPSVGRNKATVQDLVDHPATSLPTPHPSLESPDSSSALI